MCLGTEMENFMKKKYSFYGVLSIAFLFILVIFLFPRIQNQKTLSSNPITKSSFLLDTIVTVTIYDSDDMELLEDCLNLCKEYENLFSKTIETSEISRINHRSSDTSEIILSQATKELIEKGLYYSDLSDGAFDITIEPLASLWDYKAKEPHAPDSSSIQTALTFIDYKNISLSDNTLKLYSPNTCLDLGGIAKGFIADKMKAFLVDRGVKSAIINLGGNILCIGGKLDGSPFNIGIQKPFQERNETVAAVAIKDMSVVSSGIYERYFIENDILYHHILNPKTGYPYENNLISVSIISPFSVDGDGLSTTCFALGLTKGMELINDLDGIYAIFITDDHVLHYSDNFDEILVKE